MFVSEAELVRAFTTTVASEASCFPRLRVTEEFGHSEGRADVIGVGADGAVYAFEAKLHRWKECLHQAYRNSFYAHYSYVILPARTASEALRRQHEFERRGVGLCAIGTEKLQVVIEAQRKEPLKGWLTRAAERAVEPEVTNADSTLPPCS